MKRTPRPHLEGRRRFLKRAFLGGAGLAWGGFTVTSLLRGRERAGLRLGFPNDAPAELGPWAREAAWYERSGRLVRCLLCPHECVLAERDRGFCRTRVVHGGRLHTLAYGNPCAVHVDPMEKKPLFHFLPGTPILSIATAGCNLRCLNCQNWEISQAKPDRTRNWELPPDRLVAVAAEQGLGAIAYTYAEPIVFYEYVRDSARLARSCGLRNVLVTAGYGSERPMRELARLVDAANVDLKGFTDRFYRSVTGATLAPVLRCLEVLREEGVWIEVTRLVVPEHSDDLEDIRALARWVVRALGPGTPLHLSRFHPAYRLERLPPTPVALLDRARRAALEEGLCFVYVGNVPGHGAQETRCPRCSRAVVRRRGYRVLQNDVRGGRCPCGEAIPGVWT